jgi:hypothetical protein
MRQGTSKRLRRSAGNQSSIRCKCSASVSP